VPRSKPEKCIEHRITLGNVERDFLKSIKTSERIGVLDPYLNDPDAFLRSPFAIMGLAGVIGLLLEIAGFNTPVPMVSETREWLKDLRQQILDRKISIGIALDEIRQRREDIGPFLKNLFGSSEADALLAHWDKWSDIAADKVANRSSSVVEREGGRPTGRPTFFSGYGPEDR